MKYIGYWNKIITKQIKKNLFYLWNTTFSKHPQASLKSLVYYAFQKAYNLGET